MDKTSKIEKYRSYQKSIEALLEGVYDEITVMSSITAVLFNEFEHYFWAGFYRVFNESQLIIGPYQGTVGCLFIDFGKGVCGDCAERKESIIVPDVHQYSGHIACDSRSNSEIVVPVFNGKKELIAVFDVDSTEYSAFDEIDQEYLEKIVTIFRRV